MCRVRGAGLDLSAEAPGEDEGTSQSGTIVLPEFVASRWWDKALHNQSGLLLRFALRDHRNLVVANTRCFLGR
ncbi:MAG: hypothetical protein LC772_03485 [Chloroflexi bacterium]|nr:hypothetical protein [Chloroflexota bacterium]